MQNLEFLLPGFVPRLQILGEGLHRRQEPSCQPKLFVQFRLLCRSSRTIVLYCMGGSF